MSASSAGSPPRTIPIVAAEADLGAGCEAAEPFALRVLGGSLLPVFEHGDIVVIEPGGLARDGAFVLLQLPGEGWVLRQLRWLEAVGEAPLGEAGGAGEAGEAGWWVRVLDASSPPRRLADLTGLAGVVIQRVKPGRRARTRWFTAPDATVQP